jgi:hypothetical protein
MWTSVSPWEEAAAEAGAGGGSAAAAICLAGGAAPRAYPAAGGARVTPRQGLTLVHVIAQLEQLQDTFLRQVGLHGGQKSSS